MYSIKILKLGQDHGDKKKDNKAEKGRHPGGGRVPRWEIWSARDAPAEEKETDKGRYAARQCDEQSEALPIPVTAIFYRGRLLCDTDLPGRRPATGYGNGEEALDKPTEAHREGIQEKRGSTLLDPQYRTRDKGSLAHPSRDHQDSGYRTHPGGSLGAWRGVPHADQKEQILQRGLCGTGGVSHKRRAYAEEEGGWVRGGAAHQRSELQHIAEYAAPRTSPGATGALAERGKAEKRILHRPDPRGDQPEDRV